MCDVTEWRRPERVAESLSGVAVFWTEFYIISAMLTKYGYAKHMPMASVEVNLIRFRFRNLLVSMAHSAVAGGISAALILSGMGADLAHYDSSALRSLLQMVIGYFLYDVLSLLANDDGPKTREMAVHHVVCILTFSTTLLHRCFMPFACVTLLIEIHSLFLHWRAANKLLDRVDERETAVLRILNIVTLVIFRLGVSAWMIVYVLFYAPKMHVFYATAGWMSTTAVVVVNYRVTQRLLYADGWLTRPKRLFGHSAPEEYVNGRSTPSQQRYDLRDPRE